MKASYQSFTSPISKKCIQSHTRMSIGTNKGAKKKIKALLFDMDGTITKPTIDFRLMRERTGVPKGMDILEFVKQSKNPQELHEIIVEVERDAPMIVKEDWNLLVPMLKGLKDRGVCIGLVTRNSKESMEKFVRVHGEIFDVAISRDCHEFVKPDERLLQYIAHELKVVAHEVVMIGDSHHDIVFGKKAMTVYVSNGDPSAAKIVEKYEPSFVIEELKDLAYIIKEWNI